MVEVELQLPGQLGARYDADADDHEVSRNPVAVRQLDGLYLVVIAFEPGHPRVETNVDAAADVRVAVEIGHHGRHRTADQAVGGLDDRH